MMPPNNVLTINKAIDVSQRVMPSPDPDIACGNALKGGYIVQPPLAGPVDKNNDVNIITLERKKNQYDNMFINPEAISRAPICNGIRKLAKVPLNPAVRTKNTMMVPCMVTRAR